jgi:hypothetical protein
MNRRLWFIVWMLCCLISPVAFAQGTEPYHVKSDVLGETMATFRQNHRDEALDCPNVPSPPAPVGLRVCQTMKTARPVLPSLSPGFTNEPLTYAGEQAYVRIAWFDDEILFKIIYLFDFSSHEIEFCYGRLLQPLTEHFGKPTEVKELDFPNLTGSNVKNHVAIWKNEVSTIRLEQFADGASDSHSTQLIFSLDKLADDAAQRQYKARHAKSDM